MPTISYVNLMKITRRHFMYLMPVKSRNLVQSQVGLLTRCENDGLSSQQKKIRLNYHFTPYTKIN